MFCSALNLTGYFHLDGHLLLDLQSIIYGSDVFMCFPATATLLHLPCRDSLAESLLETRRARFNNSEIAFSTS
jgi:hypothetical protein